MNNWDNDPRWRKVREFLDGLDVEEDEADPESRLRRIQQSYDALVSIAADSALPSDQRVSAQRELDDFAVAARGHTAEVLKGLAEISESQDATPDTRAKAQADLESALLRLREVISDPATPDEIKRQATEGRGDFWAS
jgi:uncharacterized protein (UPF0147 family)